MNEIVESYLPLVQQVVNRIARGLPQHISKDDLISMGTVGLLKAADRFEPDKGVKFETFATWRIRGAILDGLREMDWVPRQVRQWQREIERAYQAVEAQKNASASDEDVAAFLGIDTADFQKRLTQISLGGVSSLEESLHYSEEGLGLHEILPDPNTEDPLLQVAKEEMKSVLAAAINRLPEKEKIVVALYYYEELTIKEIAEVLEVTSARISQLHTKAICRLRGSLSRKRQEFK